MNADTIVALCTGSPPTAVAMVRLSGPEAYRIAASLFTPFVPEPRRAVYGRFSLGDDGVALPFARGASYTGEETVELTLHGGRASVDALLDACLAAGARPARPGEFTLRAFANGRLDLTQAEAVVETVEAETPFELRAAHRNREGGLRRRSRRFAATCARCSPRWRRGSTSRRSWATSIPMRSPREPRGSLQGSTT